VADALNPMKPIDSISALCGARTRSELPCKRARERRAARDVGSTAVHQVREPRRGNGTVASERVSILRKLRRNDVGSVRWSELPKETEWLTPPRSRQSGWDR
jgi:hypothetical protein